MKVRFDFSVDAWMEAEIEGLSMASCKEKLMKMSLEELIEEGYVNGFSIEDVQQKVLEEDFRIRVTDIEYDTEGLSEEEITALPTEADVRLFGISPDASLYDEIKYEIEDGVVVDGFEYEIVERD